MALYTVLSEPLLNKNAPYRLGTAFAVSIDVIEKINYVGISINRSKKVERYQLLINCFLLVIRYK